MVQILDPLSSAAGYIRVGSSTSGVEIITNVIFSPIPFNFDPARSAGGALLLSLSTVSTWWVCAGAAMRGHRSLRCVRKV